MKCKKWLVAEKFYSSHFCWSEGLKFLIKNEDSTFIIPAIHEICNFGLCEHLLPFLAQQRVLKEVYICIFLQDFGSIRIDPGVCCAQ